MSDSYMPTDKQYDGQLIDEYNKLMRIRAIAKNEGSKDTVSAIDNELKYLLLKLKPIVLPTPEDWENEK